MNEYQIAFEDLKNFIRLTEDIQPHMNSLSHCVEVLQELVDRATPKKPIMRDDNEYLECPNCDYPLSKTNYCEHCGQALDWSEE